MATPIHIPSLETKKWSGIFPGWISGVLWKAFNVDAEKYPGKLILSKRLYAYANSTTLANLGPIDAFKFSDADATSRFWALSRNGRVFKSANSSNTSAWAQDTIAGTPTDCVDMDIHEDANGEDRLVVSRATNISILNSANWANLWKSWWIRIAIASSTDATPIEITTSGNHGFIDGDTVTIVGHTTNVAANGTWIVTRVDATKFTLNGSAGSGAGVGAGGYVGYLNLGGSDVGTGALTSGYPHPVDTFNRLFMIGDKRWIHTIDRDDNVSYKRLTLPITMVILHIMHSRNRVWILCYDRAGSSAGEGGAVVEWDGTSSSYLNIYPVHGAAAIAGCIADDVPVVINEKGIILRFNGSGFSETGRFLNAIEDQLSFRYTSDNASIKPRGMFYSKGLIHIALSSDASNGNPYKRMDSGIWIHNMTTGDLRHKYSFTQFAGSTNLDFGQPFISKVGSLLATGEPEEFFSSAEIYTNYSGTTKSYIYLLNSLQDTGRGSFVTPRLTTSEAEQMWALAWIKFKKFVSSDNRIIFKVRGVDPLLNATNNLRPLTSAGTWVNTTSFTAVVPTGVVVGDEVEILAGDNAGVCTHIVTLSATPDGVVTITVTVDAVPYASTRGIFVRYEKWSKMKTISDTAIKRDSSSISVNSEFCQLKVEMYGSNMEIDEIIIENKTNQIVDKKA